MRILVKINVKICWRWVCACYCASWFQTGGPQCSTRIDAAWNWPC